jgi:ubiquinone/menaquinone biosynthesis C-methylase UbiE
MDENVLKLLCDPATREPLRLQADALVNVRTGKQFPIRSGIPDFLETASGQNKKYQELYDRIAVFYDVSERLYFWIARKKEFRKVFLDELEVRPASRILEVSVGTGANLRYFPIDSALFGLDLSWGMLRRCQKNMKKWKLRPALFHGQAESLPFRDEIFDVVFHVGGINFFNDKKGAILEMIRVAKPGTRIVIVDETEKVVKKFYARVPFVRKYFKKADQTVPDPLEWVPKDMREVSCKEIIDGKAYRLMFRKP